MKGTVSKLWFVFAESVAPHDLVSNVGWHITIQIIIMDLHC